MFIRILAAAFGAALVFAPASAEELPPPPPALKQTVLLSFPFGQSPSSGLTVGRGGALFGAAGSKIYELFQDAGDVWRTRVIFDATQTAVTGVIQLDYADGELYGLSTFGGANCSRFPGPGCGFLFTLKPTADPAVWTRTSLYEFPGDKAGRYPVGFAIARDGDVVAATREGGGSKRCGAASDEPNGCGTLMKLTRAGRRWDDLVLYRYEGKADGSDPAAGPAIDPAGFAFQAASQSGSAAAVSHASDNGCGSLGRLKVGKETQKLLQIVRDSICASRDGVRSEGVPIFGEAAPVPEDDSVTAAAKPKPATELLMTTSGGGRTDRCAPSGNGGCGVVLSLSRPRNGSTPWIERQLHRFGGPDGDAPFGAWLTVGKSSYGVTHAGGRCAASSIGCGVVFSVTKTRDGWDYEGTVHRFAGGAADGRQPQDRLVEVGGKIFGVTRFGGSADSGVAYMLDK